MGAERGSYGQSGSSGEQMSSGQALYHQRKNYGRAAGVMGEVSEYRVEHLITFTMDRKDAILNIPDSIRKLQLLLARGKIWSQGVRMRVDDKTIQLIDCETMELLETFSLAHVQDVQHVMNACNYNSICAIVIKEPSQPAPNIYLFQSSTVPANILCADIASAFSDIRSRKGHRQRPDTLHKYRDVINAGGSLPSGPPVNVKHKVAEWAVKAQNVPQFSRSNSSGSQPENSPEMIIFKIHRDVDMLNHALDDIEHFVTLLQKSAAATEELTMRQEDKRKSGHHKNKQPGLGITEVRARLPPKEQFIDVFQKFRLCFNLLSKLKNQIKDPNAVELVHYLFSPLAMIVHTCCGFELPRTIKTPLLQRSTIGFLRNCTTTQEMELLERLGDFWIRSRGEFPKEMYFPPYVPRFLSGWEPPPIPMMAVESRGLAAAVQNQAVQMKMNEEAWKAKGARIEEPLQPASPPPVFVPVPPLPKQSQPPRKEVNRSKSVKETRGKKLCRVIHDYNARTGGELTVDRDDLLEVLDDSRDWWKVENGDGEVGYVPDNVVLLMTSTSKPAATPTPKYVPPSPPPPPDPVLLFAQKVLPTPAPVPVVPPPPPAPEVAPIPVYTEVKKKPKPVPVVAPPKRPPLVSHRPAVPVSSTLQNELENRVSGKNQRNFILPKKKAAPDFLVIDSSSSSQQVHQWLRSLDFSSSTVASLGVLSGGQIFAMTRDEIKEISNDEGSRVYSQLMIQRNMDGYATTNEKSELKEVLKKIRESIPEDEREEEEEDVDS